MYLLDTNIISELRRPRPHGAVRAWFASLEPAAATISAVSAGEIQEGIERTRTTDPMKALEIEAWLVEYLSSITVLPLDADIFRNWARLMPKKQWHLGFDAMIAATAIRHGLIVATRNSGDFQHFPVQLFNPFDFH